MLWYAKRKQMVIENIDVVVERDSSAEAQSAYKLKTLLAVTGNLSDEQRQQ